MDLNTVTDFVRPCSPEKVADWKDGDAWLAGGTWLYSEPQPEVTRLIDIQGFNWPAISVTTEGLEIGATCRVSELENVAFPEAWTVAPLIRQCCQSFVASFKVLSEATVGGNICMALPAGPMISLGAALEGMCTLWPRGGAPRQTLVAEFVTGNHMNILAPGELLRSIFIPAASLERRFAFRRFTLTKEGRSSIFLIGTKSKIGELLFTITAATPRPVQLRFASIPSAEALHSAIEAAIQPDGWFDDVHGSPEHRRHVTLYFAEQIRQELA